MTLIVRRWRLQDPVTGDTYTVPRNPNRMSSLVRPNATTPRPRSPIDGQVRVFRAPPKPFPWEFGGVTIDRAHYEALAAWVERPNRVLLTDHVGRTWDVRLVEFAPTATRNKNLWRHEYTVRALVYGRVAT